MSLPKSFDYFFMFDGNSPEAGMMIAKEAFRVPSGWLSLCSSRCALFPSSALPRGGLCRQGSPPVLGRPVPR